MKIHLLLSAVSLLALSGCASSSGPKTSSAVFLRKPVNSAEAIRAFEAPNDIASQSTRLDRKVEAMSQEISTLRAYMLLVNAAREDVQQDPTLASFSKRATAPGSAKSNTNRLAKTASILAPDQMTLSVGHAEGRSQLDMDDEINAKILIAAKYSSQIVIHGRTAGDRFSPKLKSLAIDRAVRTKAFLVQNGIDPAKIRITYRTFGAFKSDNSTPEGRAQNRQTDIEFVGLDVAQMKTDGRS